MTRYQVPREETSINLTNISEQVYLYSTATCAIGIHYSIALPYYYPSCSQAATQRL